MADYVRVTVGLGYAMVLFGTTQAEPSAGIGVISMAMAATNILDNKALALPNVRNLHRLLTYQLRSLTTELLPAILIVMQHS